MLILRNIHEKINLNNPNLLNKIPSIIIFFILSIIFFCINYFLKYYIITVMDSVKLFLLGSFTIYFLYYILDFLLTLFSPSYRNIQNDKKFYILSNIIKSSLLFIYSPLALEVLYQTIYLNYWDNTKIKNMGSLYSITDFVSLFMVENMNISTKIHHICVVIFYCVNIYNDYNNENVIRLIVIYAIFSTFSYVVNFILASRYFNIQFSVKKNMNLLALIVYVICCSLNWSWNLYYLFKLFYINNHISIFVYLFFVSFVIYDDIILIRWLNFKKNEYNNFKQIKNLNK